MTRSKAIDDRLAALDVMLSDGRPRSALELACIERQRDDFLRGHERGLVWREDEVQRTLGLCSLVKHWKGERGGTAFKPEPWQEHLVFAPLYGWFTEREGVIRRRFTSGYCEVPRKNGKTFQTSVLGIRGLAGDSEHGPEIYSAAAAREQAGRLFEDMRQAVISSRTLSNRIEVRAHSLLGKHNNGVARAVSAEAKTLHGLNPSVALLDELHAHPNASVFEAMRTGQGARQNPLLFAITTAGSGRTSLCWEQREISRQVLERHATVDSHFAFIATADMADDITDPHTWWKANPNLGVSVHEAFLRNEAAVAAKMPTQENSFRRLHLNQWVEQETRWIAMTAWDACNETVPDADLIGRRCYAGLDLASTRDISALVLLFPMDDGKYVLKPFFWAPKEAMNDRAERDRKDVCYWIEKGFIEGTEGNTADVDGRLPDAIIEAMAPYNVIKAVYDPWGPAEAVRQKVVNRGFPEETIEALRQTMQNLAGPTKEFERLVYDRKIIHNGNPVLRWMMSNVAIREDAGGNIRLDKSKCADKIDGIMSSIMALTACIWLEKAEVEWYVPGALAL